MVTSNGSGLGWTFETELDDLAGAPAPSGLALRNVRHDGHNFAQDIRLIGLWVTLEHIDTKGKVLSTEKKFIEVSEKHFQVDTVRTIDPKPVTSVSKRVISRTFDYLKSSQSGLRISDYFQDDNANYMAYGLRANYAAPALFANLQLDNCDRAGLSIEQTLLLSRYGNDPPHEPSGGLSAARCHPMIAYKLIPNPTRDWSKPFVRVASLRFDFRLHLYLDTYLKDKTATGLYNANQAGLFADSHTDGTGLRAVYPVFAEDLESAKVDPLDLPGCLPGPGGAVGHLADALASRVVDVVRRLRGPAVAHCLAGTSMEAIRVVPAITGISGIAVVLPCWS
jgi:hypothetical protein